MWLTIFGMIFVVTFIGSYVKEELERYEAGKDVKSWTRRLYRFLQKVPYVCTYLQIN